MTVNDTEEGGLLRIEIQLHTKDKGFQAAAKPGSKNLDASHPPLSSNLLPRAALQAR